ncbi:hypothetical protein M9H77_14693 [Catharanthus roseus]|uniref:Uncharacterized protein n=1 Tax=Catharanthus roseus TaxID=4058 RepID=A0ACC0BNS2_CATRO|nr:hypothetical protein M9H77_14693 [Catharanthus roseus]
MEITGTSSPFPYPEDYISPFFQDFETDFDFNFNFNHNSQVNLSKKRKRVLGSNEANALNEVVVNNFLNFDYQQQQQQQENPQNQFYSFQSLLGSFLISQSSSPERDQVIMKQDSNSSGSKRARRGSPEAETSSSPEAGNGNNPSGSSSQRRLWVKNRSKAWWEQCNSPDFPEEEFRRAFRMSRSTFDMICEELESVVTKKDTMLRLAIPVRQRVAVCIWRLATGEPLREVSKRFGLGISTCHKLVLEVCSAIRNVLMPKFLQWPNEEKIREIKRDFEIFSGIPNVAGTMYTTHVPIIAPKVSVASYFNKRHTERNQKTSYSITVQGVVDSKGMFTDICVGWPGSMTDDKVLEQSALYQRANRGLLKDVLIVGNGGYPLMDWLLVPYTRQNLTWTQHALNEKVGEVQKIGKEAFMRLKGRWKCLQKRTEVKLQDLPIVLGACCVLHNICEMRNEEFNQDLRFDLFDDEVIPENVVRSINAVQARDQIAHKLLHHNLAGTTFL